MKEINFNTSKKDLAEAKIHHMLTEVMAKPQLRQRKYRYYKSLIARKVTDFTNSNQSNTLHFAAIIEEKEVLNYFVRICIILSVE